MQPPMTKTFEAEFLWGSAILEITRAKRQTLYQAALSVTGDGLAGPDFDQWVLDSFRSLGCAGGRHVLFLRQSSFALGCLVEPVTDAPHCGKDRIRLAEPGWSFPGLAIEKHVIETDLASHVVQAAHWHGLLLWRVAVEGELPDAMLPMLVDLALAPQANAIGRRVHIDSGPGWLEGALVPVDYRPAGTGP